MAEVEIKDTGSYLEEEREKQDLNLIPDFQFQWLVGW